jgi:hypothetical protein
MRSDPFEGVVRSGGEAHVDDISWLHGAAAQDDSHDPGLAHEPPVLIAPKDGVEQAWLEGVDLSTRVAQPGDLDDCLGAYPELGALGQCEQVQIPGRDVLAKLARSDVEALPTNLGEQLSVDEVHLSEVRLGRVRSDA